MRCKVRYILIPLLLILGLFIGLTTINNKEENLRCDILSITTQSEEGKPAIKLVFEYEWSKMPMRLSADILKIDWDKAWKINDFSININGNDVTDRFNINFNDIQNNLVLRLNSNANFLSKETFKGEVVLVPEDTSEIDSEFCSASSIQYVHKGLFNKIIEADSVGWENKTLLSKAY